jgi:hypothetical protein
MAKTKIMALSADEKPNNVTTKYTTLLIYSSDYTAMTVLKTLFIIE